MFISARLLLIWLFLIADVGVMNAITWFASKEIGSPLLLQLSLIFLGVAIGLITGELCWMWQWHVARMLHFEDVLDGVCPDHEYTINDEAIWRWYVKSGSPWWLNPRRKRPRVRWADTWWRFEAYDRAMKRQLHAVKNHGR
ncbi:hypothetical protein [Burkholderia ubonensis]|uniref:hypothetical protein n=1 Tax=Burkholderia ubonensis TaxID=101571 RepID=UPI0012FBD14F|nr:hypothetical protein [Burkholderia ubonensis]